MELHLDIKTGDLHLGDKYVIRYGMTRKELLAQEGIEKLFYNDAVYDDIDAMMHTFEDRGHSVFMVVNFDYIKDHPEDAKIFTVKLKLDDATARIANGVSMYERMDIEAGYVDYVRKITGVSNFWFSDLIDFTDKKGSIYIEKTLQAPNICIAYAYWEE